MKEFNITLGVMEALKVQPFEIVSQDINGNKLNITLVRDGSLQPYLLTGTTVILYFKREDDIRYQQYATITNATQGQIEIVLDADIIANRGKVFAEVAVYVGEEMKCTSQLFAFMVRKNINDGETHVSGNDLPNYHREMQRLETILDNLIISAGDSNPEIVAARYSLLEGVTFTTLGDRLDFIESKVKTHIDAKIEDGAVHGIRVNVGELEFLLNGEWKKVSGMEVHDNDMHNPAFATASDLTTHLAENANKAHGGKKYAMFTLRGTSLSVPNLNRIPIPFTNLEKNEGSIFAFDNNNPSRINIPNGVNKVKIRTYVPWFYNDIGYRGGYIAYNGVTPPLNSASNAIPANNTTGEVGSSYRYTRLFLESPIINVQEGDYFQILVWQNSGNSLDVLGDYGSTSNVIQMWCEIEVIE